MKLEVVLKGELEKIKVPEMEVNLLWKFSREFISLLKKNKLNAFVGGSLAKKTLIKKEKQDVDIFVVFDYSEDILNLEKVLGKIKLPGELKKVHGSRDYFQIDCGNFIFEVIPVVRNEDPELAENVTDVSLSHVRYVGGEIEKNPKLADEIRLAKSFCRANNFYGAESYIRGFSGYSLEVLIIHFGSFVKFLKDISKRKVIDTKKYFKNERGVLREINSSKLQGPLVVVDPTFKYRNVTAGLGKETYERFLQVSSDFLKKPSELFFQKREIDIESLRIFASKKKLIFVELEIFTDRQEGDIAGAKCKKFFDFFVEELKRKQQVVLKKEFDYSGFGNVAKGYLVVKENKEIEVRGPHIDLTEATKKYLKVKKNFYKKKDYYWCREKTSIEEIFGRVNAIGKEMGAWAKAIFK